MAGYVSNNDAKMIGAAVNKINRLTNKTNSLATTPLVDQRGIPAKITQKFLDGTYSLEEQKVNPTGTGFTDFDEFDDAPAVFLRSRATMSQTFWPFSPA